MTRSRIARLETSEPHRQPAELLAVIGFAMDIEPDAVLAAILEDARVVDAEVRERLRHGTPWGVRTDPRSDD